MGKTGRIIWYGAGILLFLAAFVVVMARKPSRNPLEIAAIALGLACVTVVPWWDAVQAD
jgi:hypothetical protein